MIKQCQYVLEGLQSLVSNSEEAIAYRDDSPCFCLYSDVSKTFDYSLYANEIHLIIHQLQADGYLLPYENDVDHSFTLTFKGLHPYRVQLEVLKVFLFKSVLVPIAVSIATSLITMAICS